MPILLDAPSRTPSDLDAARASLQFARSAASSILDTNEIAIEDLNELRDHLVGAAGPIGVAREGLPATDHRAERDAVAHAGTAFSELSLGIDGLNSAFDAIGFLPIVPVLHTMIQALAGQLEILLDDVINHVDAILALLVHEPQSSARAMNVWIPAIENEVVGQIEIDEAHISWWIGSSSTALLVDGYLASRLLPYGLYGTKAFMRQMGVRSSIVQVGSLRRILKLWWRTRGSLGAREVIENLVNATQTHYVGRPIAEQAKSEADATATILNAMQQLAATGRAGDVVVQTNTVTAALVVDESGRWSTRVIAHTPTEIRALSDDPEALLQRLRARSDAVLPPMWPPGELQVALASAWPPPVQSAETNS